MRAVLSFDFSPDFGAVGVDLSSEDSDDILAGDLADFLDGGVNDLGVRFGAAQSFIERVGSGFSGHNRTPL